MKHLILLAFKYIRRQKLRTFLTFMCVTLSIFIFCTFGAYSGSLYKTLINTEIKEMGSWEADIAEWVNNSPKGEEALDIIANHAAVSECNAASTEWINGTLNRLESLDKRLHYITVSDGKNSVRASGLSNVYLNKNPELMSQSELNMLNFDIDTSDGSCIVPKWVKDWGYDIGDTITFKLCMTTADYDENSEIIRTIRKLAYDEKGYTIVGDDPARQGLDDSERSKVEKAPMDNILSYRYDLSLNDYPLINESCGKEYEYTVKIGGFASGIFKDSMMIIRYKDPGHLFPELMQESVECMSAYAEEADIIDEQSMCSYVYICTNPRLDYDEAMQSIYESLGFSGEYYLSDYGYNENDLLLTLELRSAKNIGGAITLIVILMFFCLLVWFMARFVIDNAFEISAKERSSQYAALRVMGASKKQIVALVFTEAMFYIFTSVPLGAILAFLFCKVNVSSIQSLGFPEFEYCLPLPMLIVILVLSVIAILISAFTSAMWASRKLSPAEALNFGKPKSRKAKKVRHRKSKLDLSSKKFIKRYTWKNIMRTKSRFIIATITMSLGVTLFIFTLITGISLVFEWKSFEDGFIQDDFEMWLYDAELSDIYDSFEDNELFSNFCVESLRFHRIASDKRAYYENTVKELVPEGYQLDTEECTFKAVDRHSFEMYYQDKTEMTYDELVRSNGAIFCSSTSGDYRFREYDSKGREKKKYEEYHRRLEKPVLLDIFPNRNAPIKVVAALCSDEQPAVLFPIESDYFKSYGEKSVTVYVNVNGVDKYDEAVGYVTKFANENGAEDIMNMYMLGTGMKLFVKAIIRMVLGFVLSVWLVGVLSMVNSINTGVLNRSRELMMLRSVGMSRKQLRNTVIRESLAFSSISSVLGTVLAVLSYVLIAQDFTGGLFAAAMVGVGILSSFIINTVIAVMASLPGIRSLERAESLVKNV